MKTLRCMAVLILVVLFVTPAQAGYERDFAPGSLIIPMDLSYRDHGMFQAYGLVFQLLRNGITVYWTIDPDKVWHAADCDTDGDECAWDCAEEGSGVKCPYPTASPDFYVATSIVWDGEGQANPGDLIANHGYRGGPFVIDSADAAAALDIINAWNDESLWGDNPWAQRTVFNVVSVHENTAAFSAYVRKEMVAAPTIAVFADGNEDIATKYLRAAGIPQSNGMEFPASKCGDDDCGPGTDNPDMLTVPSIMGDMGTCSAPNYDHKNGALFTADGVPAYCQIMTMHWNVSDRESVECNGGGCPATQAECDGEVFTYHGHEVVAEVRQFLQYPVHFFAECQAVNAYENTVPNPAWPFLDDADRLGHFLTTIGHSPTCTGDNDCVGTDTDYECIAGACDDGARDCCQPSNEKEMGAGFLIADQPNGNDLKIFYPEIPYNQMDGFFQTVGGSEPAYNLSDYLQTNYKNDLDVTFITGPNGPGDQDVWMTGFLDGDCWIGCDDDTNPNCEQGGGDCNKGKVSYLGGHAYKVDLPLSDSPDSQGTRLFLNALLEADCVTTLGQPAMSVSFQGASGIRTDSFPAEATYVARFANSGLGIALDAVLHLEIPQELSVVELQAGGSEVGQIIEWTLGSIGSRESVPGDPLSSGSRWADLSFPQAGEYVLQASLDYRVGASQMTAGPVSITINIGPDVEATDAGISDGGTDPVDGGSDPTDGGTGSDGDTATSDCGCQAGHGPQGRLSLLLFLVFLATLKAVGTKQA